MSRADLPTPPPHGHLGTFAGVFTPSVLTILGLILFQRLGYVVGAGGLPRALAIITVATGISVLTSLSLAAIATNMRVRGGGDYYLISRTLGAHYGGAIGLVLFLAQSVSVAFYCIGFGEAAASLISRGHDPAITAGIAAIATLTIGVIAYLGADLATRFQYIVMAGLGFALASLYLGAPARASMSVLRDSGHTADGAGFWALFAIFFPAVTGFTQGVSMSGDLRDAARSIPRGTFWAIGVSAVVYFSVAILMAASLPLKDLAADYGAMRRIAAIPWLIDVGVIAATLSSAMASCLGAPRILQSLARDGVVPPLRPFAHGAGPTGNPRRGVLLATAIALATISLGSLNAIASVVGMCFLLSYGLLNYATFIEARARSPAFRPRFRFYSAWLSLGGAALSLTAGIAISPIAAAITGALLIALYQYLRRFAPPAAWADSRYAYHVRRIRDHLDDIREGSKHPHDWRPHVLALCNEPGDWGRLLTFASWIDGNSGFTTAVRILLHREGSGPELAAAEESLGREVSKAGVSTFTRVVSAPDILDGFAMLTQAHGLGPLRANTILMDAHEQLGEPVRAGDAPPPQALDAALRQGKNVVLLEARPRAWQRIDTLEGAERTIDLWWRGDATSRLSLLLAHLMTRTNGWRDARLRVHIIGEGPHDAAASPGPVQAMLEEARIDAEVDTVDFTGPESLVKASRDAAMVFIPLRIRGRRLVGPRGGHLAATLRELPVTALVVAGEDIDLDAEPDDVPGVGALNKGAPASELRPLSSPARASARTL